MKKLLLMLMTIICSLWHFQTLAASDSTQITLQAERPDKNDSSEKGHRMPFAPIICTIDFKNHRIELSSSEFIIAYELWDEDGTYVIGSNASDSEFVDFISGLSDLYQLRLIGVEHVYIGYLEL